MSFLFLLSSKARTGPSAKNADILEENNNIKLTRIIKNEKLILHIHFTVLHGNI